MGYNVILNRHVAQTTPVPTSVAGRLRQVWSTPQAAASWVVDVVGEHVVTTCATCPKASKPGQGLITGLSRESTALAEKLDAVVASLVPPTRDALEELSGPNVTITREVIEALRELPVQERAIVQSRLVNDIAVSRTLEKSFYARRLLVTGGQVPEVLGNAVATTHVARAVATLDAETERLLFEYKARQEVVSDTAQRLLRRATGIRETSRGIPKLGPLDNRPLIDGRVPR